MKQMIFFFVVFTYTLPAPAQLCSSGTLDARVAKSLKTELFDLSAPTTISVEKIRDVKIKSPGFPKSDVQYVKITSDNIPVQVYNPHHQNNLPIIISYHAGGFVTPVLPFMEYDFWRQAKTYNSIVFAVDYRIAPEHKYPAAVNDAYNAFKWIALNGGKYGGDTGRMMLLGVSAGGNLAAVVTQMAKKEGLADRIKLQVLNCPSTDNPRNSAKHPSYQQYAAGYFLTKEFCEYYISVYAPGEDLNNPEVGPLNGRNLSGLPPAVVITAEFDPVRDEAAEYVERLKAAGVSVTYKCFPGQIHCLLGLPPDANELKEVDHMIIEAMKTVLK